MITWLPNILGVACLALGYVFARIHELKKHSAEAEENSLIQSRWVSRHVYKAD